MSCLHHSMLKTRLEFLPLEIQQPKLAPMNFQVALVLILCLYKFELLFLTHLTFQIQSQLVLLLKYLKIFSNNFLIGFRFRFWLLYHWSHHLPRKNHLDFLLVLLHLFLLVPSLQFGYFPIFCTDPLKYLIKEKRGFCKFLVLCNYFLII